jgi:hypothetical protein
MIEKRSRWRRRRRALSELQRKWQYRRCPRGEEQRGEVQALTAILLTLRTLPIRGRLGGGGRMSIGVGYRAQLRHE